MRALVTDIERGATFDGPGIRTVVYFKGCSLRCLWCSNPETQKLENEFWDYEGSLYKGNRTSCSDCIATSTLKQVAKDMPLEEVFTIVMKDENFYRNSGGGVTLSGGEVCAQPVFATNLLMECKKLGINTAVETSGYAELNSILELAQFVDLFLYDIKNIDSDRHEELTGVRNEKILRNLVELIQRGYKVKVRMPLIKGLNTGESIIRRTMEFCKPFYGRPNFMGVDLLPYHKLGVNKYKQLGKKYSIEEDVSMTDDDLQRIERWICEYGVGAKVIRH